MQNLRKRRSWVGVVLVFLSGLLISGTALAAEFTSNEVYRLEADEVVEDDLYVAGNEVLIEGTVKGDLIAAGNRVEVHGTVEGDLMAAGSEVVLTGNVADDVRVAGAGVHIEGTVGDDLFASAGGGTPLPMPGMNSRVAQGIYLDDSAQVGGDAAFFGGEGSLEGAVTGDLYAFMGEVMLAAQVDGTANLAGDTLEVRDGTSVQGTLNYRSDKPIEIPDGVASNVVYEESKSGATEESYNPVQALTGWLWRTTLILVGFIALGALVLRFVPRLLTRPAYAIHTQPVQSGVSGLLAAALFLFFPLASLLLVLLMGLFAGWFPGLVLGVFLFSTMAMIWLLSPLVTGMWLGQRLAPILGRERGNTIALLAGVLLIVVLTRLPVVG